MITDSVLFHHALATWRQQQRGNGQIGEESSLEMSFKDVGVLLPLQVSQIEGEKSGQCSYFIVPYGGASLSFEGFH